MEPKAKTAVWVILLFFLINVGSFSQQFIVTDARGGIFRHDQNLSFSIPGPGWFRLLLDNREIYRGRGPAYPELGVNRGEERGFALSAEYYSPVDELLESLSWYIYIDKKAPAIPELEIRYSADGPRGLRGLRLLKTGAERNIKIKAWADIDGSLVYFPDLGGGGLLPADSFPALLWAEDLAGNSSEPRYEYFDISPVKIENPVSGEWLNPQFLVITGAEGKNVYWSVDGSHPLRSGGTGRQYLGPVLINRSGTITLRIAWQDPDGRVSEDGVSYSVIGADELPGDLNAFRMAEERPIHLSTKLSIPVDFQWAIGDEPRDHGLESINLRPEPLIKRVAALHLSTPRVKGIYRFAYLLDGVDIRAVRAAPVPSVNFQSGNLTEEILLYPGRNQASSGNAQVQRPLRLISAGRSRLILWPETSGAIYYSWGDGKDTGPWPEARGPLPLSLEGGLLRWFIIEKTGGGHAKEEIFGPYSVTVPSLSIARWEMPRGRIALRNYNDSEDSLWEYVSALLDYTPGILQDLNFDVCDGEDLEWAFISPDCTILERQRRDRLAPYAPELSPLPEWTRGPVTVSISALEKETTSIITARLRYASGDLEILSGTGSLEIGSAGELAEVTVESLLIDASGNRGPKTIRQFTLDPKTIYVSSELLLPHGSYNSAHRGGMDDPFSSIEEALDFVTRNGLTDIRIAGIREIREPITISNTIRIDGGWNKAGDADNSDNRAALVLGDGFSWNIAPGADLILTGLRMERKRGDNPLIQAGGNVEISGTAIANAGPFLLMSEGAFTVKDSRVSIRIAGERRIPALSARLGRIDIQNSRFQLEADYGLLFELSDGNFSSNNSVFLAAGGRTASLFNFSGVKGNLVNLTLQAAANDYASILETTGSELVLSGGILEVSARDVTSILLDNSAALIEDARIRVEGSFSARAMELRGLFPVVKNSQFFSTGSAKISEVFSGRDLSTPQASSITGNRFSGFTHILGMGWPLDRLQGFNSAYASPDSPNQWIP